MANNQGGNDIFNLITGNEVQPERNNNQEQKTNKQKREERRARRRQSKIQKHRNKNQPYYLKAQPFQQMDDQSIPKNIQHQRPRHINQQPRQQQQQQQQQPPQQQQQQQQQQPQQPQQQQQQQQQQQKPLPPLQPQPGVSKIPQNYYIQGRQFITQQKPETKKTLSKTLFTTCLVATLAMVILYGIYELGRSKNWFGESFLPYSMSTCFGIVVAIGALYFLYKSTASLMCLCVCMCFIYSCCSTSLFMISMLYAEKLVNSIDNNTFKIEYLNETIKLSNIWNNRINGLIDLSSSNVVFVSGIVVGSVLMINAIIFYVYRDQMSKPLQAFLYKGSDEERYLLEGKSNNWNVETGRGNRRPVGEVQLNYDDPPEYDDGYGGRCRYPVKKTKEVSFESLTDTQTNGNTSVATTDSSEQGETTAAETCPDTTEPEFTRKTRKHKPTLKTKGIIKKPYKHR